MQPMALLACKPPATTTKVKQFLFEGCVCTEGTLKSQVYVYVETDGDWGMVEHSSICAFNGDSSNGDSWNINATLDQALFMEQKQLKWWVLCSHQTCEITTCY